MMQSASMCWIALARRPHIVRITPEQVNGFAGNVLEVDNAKANP